MRTRYLLALIVGENTIALDLVKADPEKGPFGEQPYWWRDVAEGANGRILGYEIFLQDGDICLSKVQRRVTENAS